MEYSLYCLFLLLDLFVFEPLFQDRIYTFVSQYNRLVRVVGESDLFVESEGF
jgi:hypothetical protein